MTIQLSKQTEPRDVQGGTLNTAKMFRVEPRGNPQNSLVVQGEQGIQGVFVLKNFPTQNLHRGPRESIEIQTFLYTLNTLNTLNIVDNHKGFLVQGELGTISITPHTLNNTASPVAEKARHGFRRSELHRHPCHGV
jgi:hypothetical protein